MSEDSITALGGKMPAATARAVIAKSAKPIKHAAAVPDMT
jgi:hypothetical protein